MLEKNPDNWNADAYAFDTIEVQVIQDAAAAQNAVLSGQLDYTNLPSEDAAAQFPEDRFTTGTGALSTVSALFIVDREGQIVPALADVRVRRAINLAIDREAISDLNPGTTAPTNQIFGPSGEAYSEELLDETPYDLEQARELMAEAGYADGFDITMPSVAGITTANESMIEQALTDIGIEVTWESVPFQEFYSKVFGGNYGMFFMFNGLSGLDARDYKAATSAGVFNPFDLTTPEFEELVAAANSAPEEEQGEAFRAVNEYLVDEAWFAPINYLGGYYAHPNTIEFTPPLAYGESVLPFQPAESE